MIQVSQSKRAKHWARSWPGVDVVGESYYDEALRNIARKLPKLSALTYLTLSLVPENDNAYDANAVAVYAERQKIGHLSREDAARYRSILQNEVTTADGVITGGKISDERAYSFCVKALLILDMAGGWGRPQQHTPISFAADSVLVSGDVPATYVAPVSPDVADMCEPGDELTVWFKEERDDAFLFAPGSSGGSGRVGVVDASDLEKISVPREHLRAWVKDVGRTHVLVEFGRSAEADPLPTKAPQLIADDEPAKQKGVMWKLGRLINR